MRLNMGVSAVMWEVRIDEGIPSHPLEVQRPIDMAHASG